MVLSHFRRTRDGRKARQRAMGDWIQFYNYERPHQALAMKTPAATFELAA
ncbi:integrase core domain-containing protein [Roseicitreum antarcticum]